MADNTQLSTNVGSGDTIRTLEDASSIKWPAGVCVYATTVGTPDVLQIVTPAAGLPVKQETGASFTVTGTGGTFPVTDSGGSLTVDAPVGTPVFVRLSDGTSAIATLPVSLASVPSHAVTNAGTFAVQVDALPAGLATSAKQDTGNTSLASIDGKLPALGQALAAASVPIVLTAAQLTTLTPLATVAATQSGTWNVGTVTTVSAVTAITNALPAGTNNIGDVDVLTVPADPFGANADAASATGSISAKLRFIAATGIPITGTVTVTDLPYTTGGLVMHKTISAATTNATSVKGSAGMLYEIVASNINAAVRYLKLYNKATAPTVGTDTPVWTLAIPGNTAGAGIAKSIPKGLAFSLGIAFALTTEATDAGTTAVAANEIVVNLGYF